MSSRSRSTTYSLHQNRLAEVNKMAGFFDWQKYFHELRFDPLSVLSALPPSPFITRLCVGESSPRIKEMSPEL